MEIIMIRYKHKCECCGNNITIETDNLKRIKPVCLRKGCPLFRKPVEVSARDVLKKNLFYGAKEVHVDYEINEPKKRKSKKKIKGNVKAEYKF